MNLYIVLSEQEATALSCAAVWADGKHRHPNLQSARIKLREALNKPLEHATGPDQFVVDEAQRYVNLEC